MSKFFLNIITPSGQVYQNKVRHVSVPGEEGYFGILADHAPMVTLLKEGTVEVVEKDRMEQELYFAIDRGVLEVDGEHSVTILVDHALPVANAKESREALRRLTS